MTDRLVITEVGPTQVDLPDGGVLFVDHAPSGQGVSVTQIKGNGEKGFNGELTYEEYAELRKNQPDIDLPEMAPPGAAQPGNTTGRVVGEPPTAPVAADEANPPVEAETEAEASTASKVLDGVQVGLDVIGLVPGLGEVADLTNAGISALRGDWVGAGLSLAAAIPFAGWFATAGKAAKRAGDIVSAGRTVGREAAERVGKEVLEEGSERVGREVAEEAVEEGAERAGRDAAEEGAEQAGKKGNDGGKVARRDCKKFQKGPPGATYQGGRHGQVKKDSALGVRESHHVPPKSVNGLKEVDGPAISMDYADHRALSSTGRPSAHPASMAAAAAVRSGPAGFAAVMAAEIAEIEQKFPGKYEAAIVFMLLYAHCMGYISKPAL
ncbi:MAG: hypothetical protein R3B70_27860 [Polyangiaceae bacterium]